MLYTAGEMRGSVDEGIHKAGVILLLHTLQRHSIGDGFQRTGVHNLSDLLSEYFRFQEEIMGPPN